MHDPKAESRCGALSTLCALHLELVFSFIKHTIIANFHTASNVLGRAETRGSRWRSHQPLSVGACEQAVRQCVNAVFKHCRSQCNSGPCCYALGEKKDIGRTQGFSKGSHARVVGLPERMIRE